MLKCIKNTIHSIVHCYYNKKDELLFYYQIYKYTAFEFSISINFDYDFHIVMLSHYMYRLNLQN